MKWQAVVAVLALLTSEVACQGGGFNYGKDTKGEREGQLRPAEIAGISIAVVAAIIALSVTIFFCYYVYRKDKRAFDNSNAFTSRRVV
ncbi:uncharacterized protein LOC143222292 [Tachypleus tridentatus]|uniref:uncharacterized protein LOC143222292 n=1 Tax=Tachypleus tridentatus TaxID=6853 RepID=UPI003FD04CFC